MPIFEVTLLEGRNLEQKRALTESVTAATVSALGVKPEQVRIIIREVPAQHFAVGGVLKADNEAPPVAAAAS